mgnify:CR=1 FL=1
MLLLVGVLVQACSSEKDRQKEGGEAQHTADSARSAQEYMHQQEIDELVKRFDNPQREMWQKPQLVIRKLGPLKGKTVADIGAGSGYFTFPLSQVARQVIAVDVDSGFVEYLKQKRAVENAENVEVRLAPFHSPNLQPGEVHIALMVNVFHHLEEPVRYLENLHPGLKPEGALFIVDFMPGDFPVGPPNRLKVSPEETRAALQNAGFSAVKIDSTSLPYQYILEAAP